MSAWIVEKGVIDCMVQSAIEHRLIIPADAIAVGQMLWDENHRSINFRYNEQNDAPLYQFTSTAFPLDPAIVLQQVECYDYQSCEHPGYPTSAAHALYVRLIDALNVNRQLEGKGPWGIGDIVEAVQR